MTKVTEHACCAGCGYLIARRGQGDWYHTYSLGAVLCVGGGEARPAADDGEAAEARRTLGQRMKAMDALKENV